MADLQGLLTNEAGEALVLPVLPVKAAVSGRCVTAACQISRH
jgi:hypothetical protein